MFKYYFIVIEFINDEGVVTETVSKVVRKFYFSSPVKIIKEEAEKTIKKHGLWHGDHVYAKTFNRV